MAGTMNEPDENVPRYRWPWFALAFVVLGIVLAVVWMTVDVKKLERERDYNAPLPSSPAAH